MSETDQHDSPAQPTDDPDRQASAELELKLGAFSLRSVIRVSSQDLLAIGGLVSSILLSTSLLVWVSTAVPRSRPTTALLKHP